MEIEVVGKYQNGRDINSKNIDHALFFSIDDAEKIALITGNRGIQIVFSGADINKAFLVHYCSTSEVAVCRVVRLEFDDKVNATKVLERNPAYDGPMGVFADTGD